MSSLSIYIIWSGLLKHFSLSIFLKKKKEENDRLNIFCFFDVYHYQGRRGFINAGWALAFVGLFS